MSSLLVGYTYKVLLSEAFPSGYHYFNALLSPRPRQQGQRERQRERKEGERACRGARVHNNHLIGRQAKVSCFKRHGL